MALIVWPIELATQRSQAARIGYIATNEFSPRLKAFLDTIAWAEGTANDNGYFMKFGGGLFCDRSRSGGCDFRQHPDDCIYFNWNGQRTCSTAAGRYQFLTTTWEGLKEQLGLRDFSPRSQDLGAKKLIEQRGALSDVEAGRFENAAYKVAPEWASFPTEAGLSYHRQPHQTIAKLRSIYNLSLTKYQGRRYPGYPEVDPPLRSCNTVLFGSCMGASGERRDIILSPCSQTLFGPCKASEKRRVGTAHHLH